MIPWLTDNAPFPPVAQSLNEPNGLLAAGGALNPERLMDAYRHGIFPWFSPGDPLLWWSPDPRMILMPDEFRLSGSLARVLRKNIFTVRTDSAFEQVMRACAAPRDEQHGTWIDEQMIAAYCELHKRGYAHSVETWAAGKLVGGLYGVAIGRMFYGESMFSRVNDASKAALAHLCRQLQRWQSGALAPMIDCQMYTPHLASLGARTIPRKEFMLRLEELVNCTPVETWSFDPDLYAKE
jgi:leucyl/phenylalanyl-tRNA--protein transferase